MSVQQSQGSFSILAREFLLSIGKICVREVKVRIGRIRIGHKIEFEGLDRVLEVANTLIILPNNVYHHLRPQLRLGILSSHLNQLLCYLGRATGTLKLIEDWGCCQRIGRNMSWRVDERGNKPVHDDAAQLGMDAEHVSTMTAVGGEPAGNGR